MKIDEPKTPYYAPDEEGGGTPPEKALSPDDLARKYDTYMYMWYILYSEYI